MNIKITRLLQYCIAIILLTGTVLLSLPLPLSAFSPDAMVIKDNFTNPDSGWPQPSDISSALTYTGNEYSIFVKRANAPIRCYNPKIGELDNFIAEVDIKESSLPKSAGYVGLVFHMQDDLNNYAFLINNSNRTYQIVRRMGGVPHTLQSWTNSDYINSETVTNRLKVVCSGPQIDVFSNEHNLCTVRDTSIPKGFLGFEVQSAEGLQGYLFSNLVVYRGVKAGFIAAESFRDTPELAQRQQSARQSGFNVDTVEYYPAATSDYSSYVSTLISREPAVIYVVCRPPEHPGTPSACDTINSALKSYGVEVRVTEIKDTNALEFSISKPVLSQTTCRSGETVQISTEIDNAGFQEMASATGTLNITDSDGISVYTSTSEWRTIRAQTASKITISFTLSPFLKEGEYTAYLDITGYPDAMNKNSSRTEKAMVTFKILGSTFTINYVILPLFALLTGAMIAWFITQRKSSKE